jgi:hypothetical protein
LNTGVQRQKAHRHIEIFRERFLELYPPQAWCFQALQQIACEKCGLTKPYRITMNAPTPMIRLTTQRQIILEELAKVKTHLLHILPPQHSLPPPSQHPDLPQLYLILQNRHGTCFKWLDTN